MGEKVTTHSLSSLYPVLRPASCAWDGGAGCEQTLGDPARVHVHFFLNLSWQHTLQVPTSAIPL